MRALRGMATSGYVPVPALVRSRLDAENEDIRGVALEALRHMADPAVDQISPSAIRSDKSPSVRLAAIDAFKLRNPSAVLAPPLAQTAEHDAARPRRCRTSGSPGGPSSARCSIAPPTSSTLSAQSPEAQLGAPTPLRRARRGGLRHTQSWSRASCGTSFSAFETTAPASVRADGPTAAQLTLIDASGKLRFTLALELSRQVGPQLTADPSGALRSVKPRQSPQ